ncbi:hypothetical protein [Saccharopolyspora elongata]|uniref:Uncharacterized protein n=1 Tax=Saccharopolyspora elongata TaxID=2530387 RepID=A0A4R4Y2S8_9PSEU|nr:hypothetical protein [Saccharopolyspora elongata]TDD37769.1 hypothetical protein E1288_39875 [Saccharopolyspora elongata]
MDDYGRAQREDDDQQAQLQREYDDELHQAAAADFGHIFDPSSSDASDSIFSRWYDTMVPGRE